MSTQLSRTSSVRRVAMVSMWMPRWIHRWQASTPCNRMSDGPGLPPPGGRVRPIFTIVVAARSCPRPRESFGLEETSRAGEVIAVPALVDARDDDVLPRIGGMNHAALADVDRDVVDPALEVEEKVTGLEVRHRHRH